MHRASPELLSTLDEDTKSRMIFSEQNLGLGKVILRGADYLISQQKPNGSFFLEPFPAFDNWETVNAVLALQNIPPNLIPENRSLEKIINCALKYLHSAESPNGLLIHGSYLQNTYCLEASAEYLRVLHKTRTIEHPSILSKLIRIISLQHKEGFWEIANPMVRAQVQAFPSVTAFAINIIRSCGLPIRYSEAAQSFLLNTQLPAGHWGSEWEYYGTPFYAMSPILCALAEIKTEQSEKARQKAAHFLTDQQQEDGSFISTSANGPSPELETSLALQSCQRGFLSVDRKKIERGLEWLIKNQRPDGSWFGGFFPHPVPEYGKPEDVYGTAIAISVLSKVLLD